MHFTKIAAIASVLLSTAAGYPTRHLSRQQSLEEQQSLEKCFEELRHLARIHDFPSTALEIYIKDMGDRCTIRPDCEHMSLYTGVDCAYEIYQAKKSIERSGIKDVASQVGDHELTLFGHDAPTSGFDSTATTTEQIYPKAPSATAATKVTDPIIAALHCEYTLRDTLDCVPLASSNERVETDIKDEAANEPISFPHHDIRFLHAFGTLECEEHEHYSFCESQDDKETLIEEMIKKYRGHSPPNWLLQLRALAEKQLDDISQEKKNLDSSRIHLPEGYGILYDTSWPEQKKADFRARSSDAWKSWDNSPSPLPYETPKRRVYVRDHSTSLKDKLRSPGTHGYTLPLYNSSNLPTPSTISKRPFPTPIAPNTALCTYTDGSGPEPGPHNWKSTYDIQIGRPFNLGGGCAPILATLNSVQFPNLDGSENEFHGVGNYVCEDDGFGNTHLSFDTEVLGYVLLYKMIVKLQVAYPDVPFEGEGICCPLCSSGEGEPDWSLYQ